MEIAKYFASIGFKVDNKELRKVDDTLKKLEKSLKESITDTAKTEADGKKAIAAASKEAVKAEKDWINKAKEAQKISNETFRTRKAFSNWLKKDSLEHARLQDRLNRAARKTVQGQLESRLAHLDVDAGKSPTLAKMAAMYQKDAALSQKTTAIKIANEERFAKIRLQEQERVAKKQAEIQERLARAARQTVQGRLQGSLAHLDPDAKNPTLARMAAMYAKDEQQATKAANKRIAVDERAARMRVLAEERASRMIMAQREKEARDMARLHEQALRENARRDKAAIVSQRREEALRARMERINSGHVVAAGGLGGLASRMWAPAIGLGLGGYGLAQLNKRNQDVVSAQMQTKAVIEANGGTAEQGTEAFNWLRGEADRVGFNYLTASSDFNILTSNLMGAGASLEDSKTVFKGFAEYGRVNKLSNARQQLVFNALSQVAGKDKLQAEELTKQLGNSLPGAKSLFAEAWQQMTGGDLTGGEAIQALEAAMGEGKVRGDILKIAALIASERSAKGIDRASDASQAWQNRWQSQISDTAIIASDNGVESGFQRLFKSLTIALKEAKPMVESLARGFDTMSKHVSEVVLNVQSFQRFFQGRDSYWGDKLFPKEEDRRAAFEFLESMKGALGETKTLLDNVYKGWSDLLGLLDSSSVLKKMTDALNTVRNGVGVFNDLASGNMAGAREKLKSVGSEYVNTITAPGRTGANAIIGAAEGVGNSILPADRPRLNLPRFGELDAFNPAEYEANKRAQAERANADARKNGYSKNFPIGVAAPDKATAIPMAMDVKVEVKMDVANVEDFNNKFEQQFTSILQRTITNAAPIKE